MSRPSPDSWHSISPWLDEVLDLPRSARPSWLQQLQGRDPRAAQAIAAWLLEYDVMEAGAFLENRTPRTSGAGAENKADDGERALRAPSADAPRASDSPISQSEKRSTAKADARKPAPRSKERSPTGKIQRARSSLGRSGPENR